MTRNAYLGLAFVTCSSLLLLSCKKDPVESVESYPRPVKVEQIEIGDGKRIRTLPGETFASDTALLSFQVSGRLDEILVRPGEMVKAGQPLANIDPAMYNQELEVAKANYELAKVLFDRANQLVERGVISRSDFDKSKSQYAISKAALDKAKVNLSYTKLVAPYDGVIARKYAEQFEYVYEKQQVLSLQTESTIDVNFQLPERLISIFQEARRNGQLAPELAVQFQGRQDWYVASLKELSTVADPSTGSYTIVLTLPIPNELNIFPGMTTLVQIESSTQLIGKDLVAPAGSLVEDAGQSFVFTWNPETKIVTKTRVTIDKGNISTGLNDGDWLVVAGAQELVDGQAAIQWVKERGL
ncbi:MULTISPECIES: efflux RND transporter periplasmic adaptor subunit [unclassified Agarivorans]|uniref:efflux RND transporter periplasmic adaptor subunit n=1 Tax=unclassified Agarivorans TaxID=2636026 RepID=UPI0026E309FD|nr:MULTISPECIES: efflux RND transporter periplasmic adaptor subunit [unclassified Agarivorans]MDO6687818.1 efflux RND transporter periplasmic adaptor subunit [Agarivorans sp. 3_MG-2023]MDO6717318.1 efflux RND transporter periplasmic adaptor subunit [Agarivorans sp. 2_MG-2023]